MLRSLRPLPHLARCPSLSLSPSLSPSSSLSPSLCPSRCLSRCPLSLSPSLSPSRCLSLSPSRCPPFLSPSRCPSLSPFLSPSLSPCLSPSRCFFRCPSRCPPSLSPSRCPPFLSPFLSPWLSPCRCVAVSRGVPRLSLRWRLAVAVMALLALGTGFLYLRQQKQRQQRSRRLRHLRALSLSRGDFELRDTAGTPRRKSDFLGRWLLLYFGFTHCPDVCPEELQKLGAALELLERQQPELPALQPLFITVDPERDDEEALRRYLRDFHPRLLGLTGSPEQVRGAAAAFGVFVSAGPRDEEGDYVVDHSVLTILVDPQGIFRDCYGRSRTAEEMARSVRGHMESYEPLEEEE